MIEHRKEVGLAVFLVAAGVFGLYVGLTWESQPGWYTNQYHKPFVAATFGLPSIVAILTGGYILASEVGA